MPLDPGLAGRTFTSREPYLVAQERIDEFAAAIQAPPAADGSAPLSFAMVVAFGLMTDLMLDPTVGIELHNVVHRDERIEQARPIRGGDELVGTLTVESVRTAAGIDLIATTTRLDTTAGEHVCSATATLVHRSDPS